MSGRSQNFALLFLRIVFWQPVWTLAFNHRACRRSAGRISYNVSHRYISIIGTTTSPPLPSSSPFCKDLGVMCTPLVGPFNNTDPSPPPRERLKPFSKQRRLVVIEGDGDMGGLIFVGVRASRGNHLARLENVRAAPFLSISSGLEVVGNIMLALLLSLPLSAARR